MIRRMVRFDPLRFFLCSLLVLFAASCSVAPPSRVQTSQRGMPKIDSPAPVAAPVRVAAIPLEAPPRVAAESAIVVDIETGRVLYAKNADQRRAVASTQKIMTAMCVIDAGNMDRRVTIAASDGNVVPTKLWLKAGEVYTRRNLTQVLMINSANDVARALARDTAGSQEAFAATMNRKAASLGMRNSHFKNPHGLTENGQYSTARDMAIAARAAYRYSLIREFMGTQEFTFRFNDGRTRTMRNTNRVLRSLDYCNGMKTGTTVVSGRCLISTGALNGRSVIVVVLKSCSANVWSDSEQLLRWALERPAADRG